MRAVILLYAQEGYINIPIDGVKLKVNGDDISQGMLIFERNCRLVGLFRISEIRGFYVTERKDDDK